MTALGLGGEEIQGSRGEVRGEDPSACKAFFAFSLGCVAVMGGGGVAPAKSLYLSLFCDYEGKGEAKENKVPLLLHFNFVIALYCASGLLWGGGGGMTCTGIEKKFTGFKLTRV